MNLATAGNEYAETASARRFDSVIIALGAGAVLGLILIAQGRTRDDTTTLPAHSPNDRSRFATIIALVDHGTYAIDDVIERRVGDKVERTQWWTIDMVRRPDTAHFYSSKPPLLPTLLAGEYKLLKLLSGGRLNFKDHPHMLVRIIVATTNWIPLVIFLVLYSRLLDRLTSDLWVRVFAMAAAAGGTFLSGFSVTLNNHTIAGFSAFFAFYPALLVWLDDRKDWWLFAVAGLFASFTFVLELPALALAAALFAALWWKEPAKTLVCFLPFALIPLAAHCSTTYQVTGSIKPAYEKKDWYEFEGSYWKIDPVSKRLVGSSKDPKTGELVIGDPKGIDNQHEPWYVYLFHMLLGHHGVFSLTPIFLFSAIGLARTLSHGERSWWLVAALALGLTVLIVAFYILAPLYGVGQRNYGGMCNGMRWLFWLIPFWLVFLPKGLEWKSACPGFRFLSLILLAVSAASAFYATRNPWTRPWLHELLFQAGWIGY